MYLILRSIWFYGSELKDIYPRYVCVFWGGGYCGNHNYYNYTIKVLVLHVLLVWNLVLLHVQWRIHVSQEQGIDIEPIV